MNLRMHAKVNRIAYDLIIGATLCLPLSFVTSPLEVKVAGIPDEHDPRAFGIVCTAMLLIAVRPWMFFRWPKWSGFDRSEKTLTMTRDNHERIF